MRDPPFTLSDDRSRATALLAGEKRLFEMVAGGYSTLAVLEALCQLVETTVSECICSVVLVDPSGARIECGAAPSLPNTVTDSIIGQSLNAHSGPSAMAAFLNEQIISSDLSLETRWVASQWCSMALAHGLKACWAIPIASRGGAVLGAFAIYYDRPRTPTSLDQSIIEQFVRIGGIGIERVRNDAALKQSEARKAAILDSALDCVVTIDHEGRIIEFNPAAERTFGYSRAKVMGQPLVDLIIPPALRERHIVGFARFLATGESRVLGKRVEMTALRSDGSEFPVEVAITRIPLEGPPAFTGYLRDITERKQSEEELRKSAAVLDQAQRLSASGSWRLNVDTGDLTPSAELLRIFAVDPTASSPPRSAFMQRVHVDDRPAFEQDFDRAVRERSRFQHDYRIVRPDGSVRYLQCVAKPDIAEPGHLEYIGTVMDVTDRKRAEEELSNAQADLARVARLTTMGELAASIAHEVNQPLASVMTHATACLTWLDRDQPDLGRARQSLLHIVRDAGRAGEVMHGIRALAKKSGPRLTKLDINAAIEEVLSLTRSELQGRGVVLHTALTPVRRPVVGDRVQLQQVMLNLIMNGVEAMTSVTDRQRLLAITSEPVESGEVLVAVEDTGTGLDPSTADHIFDPFFTTKSEGMGMGLSICRSIINAHHGRFWVSPRLPCGTVFRFTVPEAVSNRS